MVVERDRSWGGMTAEELVEVPRPTQSNAVLDVLMSPKELLRGVLAPGNVLNYGETFRKGEHTRTVRSWSKASNSVAARLSIVPLVQCMLGPPRSVNDRSSSNVAPR